MLRSAFDSEGRILRQVADGKLEPAEAVKHFDLTLPRLKASIFLLNAEKVFFDKYDKKAYSVQDLAKIIKAESEQSRALKYERASSVTELRNLVEIEENDPYRLTSEMQERKKILEEAIDNLNYEIDNIKKIMLVAYRLMAKVGYKADRFQQP